MIETLTTIQIAIILIAAAMQVILFVVIISIHNNIKHIRKQIAPKYADIDMLLFLDKEEDAKNALLKRMYKDIKYFIKQDHDKDKTRKIIKEKYEPLFQKYGMHDSLDYFLNKI